MTNTGEEIGLHFQALSMRVSKYCWEQLGLYEWRVFFSFACQVRRQSVYFPDTILFNKLKGWEPGKRVWTGCVPSICQINNRAWKQQILLIRQDGVLLPLKCYIALIFIFYSATNYCKRFREWSKIKSCSIIHNVKIAWINLPTEWERKRHWGCLWASLAGLPRGAPGSSCTPVAAEMGWRRPWSPGFEVRRRITVHPLTNFHPET